MSPPLIGGPTMSIPQQMCVVAHAHELGQGDCQLGNRGIEFLWLSYRAVFGEETLELSLKPGDCIRHFKATRSLGPWLRCTSSEQYKHEGNQFGTVALACADVALN